MGIRSKCISKIRRQNKMAKAKAKSSRLSGSAKSAAAAENSAGENYELIISEKPKSAQKIAIALADGKPVKKVNAGVSFYLVTHGDKDIVVASTVGHIYGLTQKVIPGKKKWDYPVFDVEWKPLGEIKASSDYSLKYLDTIKS